MYVYSDVSHVDFNGSYSQVNVYFIRLQPELISFKEA